MKLGIILMLVFVLLLGGCGTENGSGNGKLTQARQENTAKSAPPEETTVSSASWVTDRMISFRNHVYTGTEEKVDSVDGKLGEIKHHLTEEMVNEPDESSNYYKEGTALYQITGVPVESGIAVETGPGHYVKAVPVEEILGGSSQE
ncbi:hypothetical protein [Paenibacillus sp. JDR-2]|uniref:hypothetical protein n=1 Tax=Paenibacillus sp. (strain JDR-2) TaxID=324057 RepID=UPI00016648BC|nr:hypothetical protein [Paenibacillus sp. JDR-2]ACT04130.1 hypothetical protein Pjdr2_5521 [Paenibacillus sp. JDR-2]